MSRILIIEDEIAINKMLCLNLGITGYETVSLFEHIIPAIFLTAKGDIWSKVRVLAQV